MSSGWRRRSSSQIGGASSPRPCTPFVVKGTAYYKVVLQEHCFQTGTPDESPEAWPFRGYHATDNVGACGIIRDRRFRLGGFNGIYASLYQNPVNEDALRPLMERIFGGKKDFSRVVFEVKLTARFKLLESGGTPLDEHWCGQGIMAHCKPDKRWLMPMERICISAVILTGASFKDFDSTLFVPMS